MAITLEKVTLSQVDFKMLKYDESDIPSFREGYPIGFTATSFQDVPFIQNLSVFGKMLNAGLNRMDLYDTNAQVIGNIQITNYQEIYVTAQPFVDYGYIHEIHYQYGDNAYMPYDTDSASRHYLGGVKFKAFSGLNNSQKMKFTVTLNNETVNITGYAGDGYFIKQVDDVYGSWTSDQIASVIFAGPSAGDYIESLGLVTMVENGATHAYLSTISFGLESYYKPDGSNQIVATQSSTNILADNLGFTEQPIKEDGYVNDLQDRFCPRVNAGSVGIYAASYNTIQLLMQGLMECDAGALLKNVFLGGDGKEYVIGLRWYYGLYDNNNVWLNLNEDDTYKIQVGGVFLESGGSVLLGKKFIGEYATWTSSEMDVPRKHDNYLDYFSDYQLYLPYYGFLKLNPNDVVGGKIRVIYNINIVTGMADIIVECKNSRSMQPSYKAYTVNAQIGVDIPYASDIMKTMVASWMQTCGKAFMTGASMGAYGATQEYANAIQKSPRADIHQDALDLINQQGSGVIADAERTAMKNAAVSKIKTGLHNAGATAKYTGAEMSAAMSQFMTDAAPSVSRTGGSNTENGTLDELYPYLVITYPIDMSPADYEDYVGLPASTSVQLNQCTGFTQVAAIKPESMVDAPKYADEIISLLQAGVYL